MLEIRIVKIASYSSILVDLNLIKLIAYLKSFFSFFTFNLQLVSCFLLNVINSENSVSILRNFDEARVGLVLNSNGDVLSSIEVLVVEHNEVGICSLAIFDWGNTDVTSFESSFKFRVDKQSEQMRGKFI